MRNHITDLPLGLISIEEITDIEEEIFFPSDQESLELRERESIFYSPFKQDVWYSSLTYFLQNLGLQYSPTRIPYTNRLQTSDKHV